MPQRFPELSANGIDLLNSLLTYDPDKRLTAAEALRHPFFSENPLPKDPDLMPNFPSCTPKLGGWWAMSQNFVHSIGRSTIIQTVGYDDTFP